MYSFGHELISKTDHGKFSSAVEVLHQSTTIISGLLALIVLPDSLLKTEDLFFGIEPWTMTQIFAFDAGTYVLAFCLIALIKYETHADRNIDRGSVIKRIRFGMQWLTNHKRVFVFGLASFSVFAILVVHGSFILNVYVDEYLEEGKLIISLAQVFYASAAVLTGIFIQRVFRKKSAEQGVLFLMLFTIMALCMMALGKSAWIVLTFQVVLGVTNPGIRVQRVVYLFRHTPNDVIGRVTTVFNSFNIALRFALILLFSMPFFSSGGHITWAYGICAVIIVLATIPVALQAKNLGKDGN